MPTVPELNAGYDALHKKMGELIEQLLPSAPFMFRGQIRDTAYRFLNGPDGRQTQLEGVRDVLEAAEKARAK